MIKPVKRNNITDQVYKQMLDNVIDGTWSPGSKIPSENELKDLFEVSRNTIRVVINKLSILGLLETMHGEGTFVRELEPSIYMNCFIPSVFLERHDFIKVMEFRRGLEVEAARLAAERATEEDIIGLESILATQEKCKNNVKKYALADVSFHMAVAKASGNKMFEQMASIIKHILLPNLEKVIIEQGNEDSLVLHPLVVAGIKERNVEQAMTNMDRHMTIVIERFKAFKG